MNARDILINADPLELRNIIKHLKPGRSAVSMIIINGNPQQYPPNSGSTETIIIGHELAMHDGMIAPPVPVESEDRKDWLYMD